MPEENHVSRTSSSITRTVSHPFFGFVESGAESLRGLFTVVPAVQSNTKKKKERKKDAPCLRLILSAETLKRWAAFSLASSSDLPLTQ